MDTRDGLIGSIGNTPLIRLKTLSDRTGCTILGKAEFLNPGGSVKDRAARYIIEDAEAGVMVMTLVEAFIMLGGGRSRPRLYQFIPNGFIDIFLPFFSRLRLAFVDSFYDGDSRIT